VLVMLLSGCGSDDPAQINQAPAVNNIPAPTTMAQPKIEPSGRDVYAHYCADCHDAGDGHPGTMQLGVRIGARRSVLTGRTDLTPDFVKNIVRNGLEMMPPYRPTEITDGELDALAEYVAGVSGKSTGAME
jgi:mono/diheme cytochrome c family protein